MWYILGFPLWTTQGVFQEGSHWWYVAGFFFSALHDEYIMGLSLRSAQWVLQGSWWWYDAEALSGSCNEYFKEANISNTIKGVSQVHALTTSDTHLNPHHSIMELELQLVRDVVREVRWWIPSAMEEEYNGCYFQHPSQLHHDCFMSEEEIIRFCIDQALDMVDWQVSTEWWQLRGVECPGCHEDKWLRELWRDECMNEMLITVLLNSVVGEKNMKKKE